MHPTLHTVERICEKALNSGDFEQIKALFQATKGRYILKRPAYLNAKIIEAAGEAKDSETVINAYLDILDYEAEITAENQESVFKNVMEAISYDEAIDHVLFGHVQEQMKKRDLDTRLYSIVYYLNINGGLTVADLLIELNRDENVQKIPNSDYFKAQFVDKVVRDDEFKAA